MGVFCKIAGYVGLYGKGGVYPSGNMIIHTCRMVRVGSIDFFNAINVEYVLA